MKEEKTDRNYDQFHYEANSEDSMNRFWIDCLFQRISDKKYYDPITNMGERKMYIQGYIDGLENKDMYYNLITCGLTDEEKYKEGYIKGLDKRRK